MSDFDKKAKDWDTPERQMRAAIIADSIRSHLPLSPEMTALEYGCGTGQLSFELREDLGAMTLADNSDGMLQVLQDKINTSPADNMTPVKLDLATDPLPEDRFDLIYTVLTLHHIADTRQVLGQFYALLNSGGYLCVADLDKEDGSFHGHEVDDVHKGFDRKELAKLAKEAGFTNISFSTAHQMERETGDEGDTKIFPIFLMIAQKE